MMKKILWRYHILTFRIHLNIRISPHFIFILVLTSFLFIHLLYWFQITIEVNEPCLSPKPYIVHNTCHNNPSLFTPSLNTFFSQYDTFHFKNIYNELVHVHLDGEVRLKFCEQSMKFRFRGEKCLGFIADWDSSTRIIWVRKVCVWKFRSFQS